jgi:cell fate (sporulation/competence/biofilm development) regulator YlbF (YheA/YmcA/DUF963 family)
MLNPTLEAPAEAEVEALDAARALGTALKASKEFAALIAADEAIGRDAEAGAAITSLNSIQLELRAEITMGVLQDSQRAELDQRQHAVSAVPSISAYLAAMAAFQAVCRDTASIVSAEIGIDFAANSRSGGCCG